MVAKLLDIDVEPHILFATFPEMVEQEFDNWINLFKIREPARKNVFVDILKRSFPRSIAHIAIRKFIMYALYLITIQ